MEKLRDCPFCGNQPYHTANGETISCMTGINEGEDCPIAGMDFTLAEWNTRHEPKHETVEQYIANYKVRLGNCLNSLIKEAMINGKHQKVVTVKEISDTLQKLDYIVANHHGKPKSIGER